MSGIRPHQNKKKRVGSGGWSDSSRWSAAKTDTKGDGGGGWSNSNWRSGVKTESEAMEDGGRIGRSWRSTSRDYAGGDDMGYFAE